LHEGEGTGEMKKTGVMVLSATAGLVACAALKPLPRAVLPDPGGLAINRGHAIRFANPLPRQRCGKNACGTYNNWELACPGFLNTLSPDFGNVLWHLRKVVWADRRLVFVDGRALTCQLNWIRDHVHQMKGYCHWEHDLTSFLDFILDTQRADGQFYELVKQLDDVHWAFVNPDCRILYPEDNQSLVRLELEADIEYLMVEGCLQAWRVTGDPERGRPGPGRHPGPGRAVPQAALRAALGGDAVQGGTLPHGLRAFGEVRGRPLRLRGKGLPLQPAFAGRRGRGAPARAVRQDPRARSRERTRDGVPDGRRLRFGLRRPDGRARERRGGLRGAVLSSSGRMTANASPYVV